MVTEKARHWRRPEWAPAEMDDALVREFETTLAQEWGEFLRLPPSDPLVSQLPAVFVTEIRQTVLRGSPRTPEEARALARELVARSQETLARAQEALFRARAAVVRAQRAVARAEALKDQRPRKGAV